MQKKELFRRIEGSKDRIISLCSELVKISSENPPGDTRKIVDFITSYIEEAQLQYKIYTPLKNNPNIVAHLKGSKPGKRLIYNGHLDTYPAGDAERWQCDPFSGIVSGGKLFGRGAADMKGGVTASIMSFIFLSEMIMKRTTRAPPTSMDIRPVRTESAPRVGPTVRSSIILTGAGKEPARKAMARSVASSRVKCPVITALPPEIRSWILGAEYTFLSRTMASRLLILAPVIRSKILAPLRLNSMPTWGCWNWSNSTRALVNWLPSSSTCFLIRNGVLVWLPVVAFFFTW